MKNAGEPHPPSVEDPTRGLLSIPLQYYSDISTKGSLGCGSMGRILSCSISLFSWIVCQIGAVVFNRGRGLVGICEKAGTE